MKLVCDIGCHDTIIIVNIFLKVQWYNMGFKKSLSVVCHCYTVEYVYNSLKNNFINLNFSGTI